MPGEPRFFVVEKATGVRSHSSLMKHVNDTRITNKGGAGASSAARKVMSLIHRSSKHKVKAAIIHVRETTRGSLGKVFSYRTRVVSQNRCVKVAGGAKVRFSFEVKCKAI